MTNRIKKETNAEIIKSCKIQENNISMDNIAESGVKKKAKSSGSSSVSLSLKPEIREKLDASAKACNMTKTAFVERLIMDSEGRIVSFPEGAGILPELALCHQILSDIRDDKEDIIPQERLNDVFAALEKATSAMCGICNKMDALLPDDEEGLDDDN